MSAPLLATRDALAKVLHTVYYQDGEPVPEWDALPEMFREVMRRRANRLLASGVVRDPASLADDEALVERVSFAARTLPAPAERSPHPNTHLALRALAAALAEGGAA